MPMLDYVVWALGKDVQLVRHSRWHFPRLFPSLARPAEDWKVAEVVHFSYRSCYEKKRPKAMCYNYMRKAVQVLIVRDIFFVWKKK